MEQSSAGSSHEGEGGREYKWGKIIVGVVLLAVLVFVIVDSFTSKYLYAGLQIFLEWIETHLVAGVFAYMAIYFLSTVSCRRHPNENGVLL